MQDRNGEKLKSVYSDSTGFDYVRQQLVDKILKPHGIPPDAYDAMLTGDIFAKLTAKSGLATLRSIGGTDSGYQFFSVTSSDVTRAPVENDGRRISRSFLARFVDQFVHDLQNRKPGSVKQTSRGTKRMGNTGFRHYYKDDVDSIVSWMQQQLETREIDLKAPFTTKPQPRVDILDDLIASFAEGIGAPEDGEMVKALLDKPRSTDALRIITYAFTEKTKPAGAKPGTYDGGSILIGAAMKAVNEELEPDEQIRSMKVKPPLYFRWAHA